MMKKCSKNTEQMMNESQMIGQNFDSEYTPLGKTLRFAF